MRVKALPKLAEQMTTSLDGDLWIFGYASLMWNPGFDFVEVVKARVYGFHRALCVRSWVHRGTRDNPGLVFGLDVGGSCSGRAFRVNGANRMVVQEYLIERELVTGVYEPRLLWAHAQRRRMRCLGFVVNRCHPQYVTGLSVERQAEVVVQGMGPSGANIDYVVNTLIELERLGVRDRRLHRLRRLLETQCRNGR